MTQDANTTNDVPAAEVEPTSPLTASATPVTETPVPDAVEPVVEPAAEPVAEPAAEPVAEPAAEPVAEHAEPAESASSDETEPTKAAVPEVKVEAAAKNTDGGEKADDAPSDAAALESTEAIEQPGEAKTGAPEPAARSKKPAEASPTKSAMPRPRPRPRPRPLNDAKAAAPVAPAPPVDAAEVAEATTWGRVDDDGTVWVRESSGERSVGQYPDAGTEDALGYFVRKFLDLLAQVKLFEARLDSTDLSIKEIDSTLAKLAESLKEPAAVGDIDGLRSKLEGLRARATEKRKAVEAAIRETKKVALAERTTLVERAEALAKVEPERVQWRQAGDEFRQLLDTWKSAQSKGPRIDRPSEESLWKRFSAARTTFDRQRRHFFAELEERNSSARTAKEKLVVEAEALSTSTDWGVTVGAYRELMTRWKAAGHAGRKDDDALWAQFRGAQDRFFDARTAANAQIDAEYQVNLVAKQALLDEVEKLVPVTDLAAAKVSLRRYQDQWDELGKVPRADMQRVEARMRAVEQTIRTAEETVWKRSNPEAKARAEGLASQLQDSIAALEDDLAAATAKGDRRKIEKAEQALEARRAWLTQALAASDEFSG